MGFDGWAAHARAHERLLGEFRAVRAAIASGDMEATLTGSDLLSNFHDHIAVFDRAAHAYQLRQQIERGEGDTTGQQIQLEQLYRVKGAACGYD